MAPDAQSIALVQAAAKHSHNASVMDSQKQANAVKEALLLQHGLHSKELARVLAKNDQWSFPASEDGWVKAHNAIRLDLKDINEALSAVLQRLQQGEAVQPWVIANLQQYWPKFTELVHHHHDNEEDIVIPELKKIGCSVPDKMSTDHVGLLNALTNLTHMINALKPSRTASADLPAWAALQHTFESMRRDMEEHLLEEEEIALVIMRKQVTQKQFKPIEKKIIAQASAELMGWFLRAFPSDQARRQWMTDIAGIPKPVQSLVMMPAHKKFCAKWYRLIDEIKLGERYPPQPTGCFAC